MEVLINKRYKWESIEDSGLKCHYIGSQKAANHLRSFLAKNSDPSQELLKEELLDLCGNFAAIIQTDRYIVAVVDKIRSYPIFYIQNSDQCWLSNSARMLKEYGRLNSINDLSLLEFQMAGYVTGKETLYENLFQLQAGEFLVWDGDTNKIRCERYYQFYSDKVRKEKEEVLIEELDDITNKIFQRIISEAKEAPIWVPLSGGLDSRLVLCKLKQLGHKNLKAFSYGASGNYEAKAAMKIAEKLKIPWDFIPIKMKEAKAFFHSKKRKDYWDFSDDLCVIPNMQDIHALENIKKSNGLPSDLIIINGQSGDFITGRHIRDNFTKMNGEIAVFFSEIIEKNFSLFDPLQTSENKNKIQNKIKQLLQVSADDAVDIERISKLYELWEWQERQSKYVVNGQRIYDYYGIKWFLPLWDDEYLNFWSQIPWKLKYNQRLYKAYLDRFDFYGCFRNFKPNIWRWPGITIGVIPIGRFIKLIYGKESHGKRVSEVYYRYLKYFGHYRYFYAPYNFFNFMKIAPYIKYPLYLNIETWMKENLVNNREMK